MDWQLSKLWFKWGCALRYLLQLAFQSIGEYLNVTPYSHWQWQCLAHVMFTLVHQMGWFPLGTTAVCAASSLYVTA